MELVRVTEGQIQVQHQVLETLKAFNEQKKEMEKLEKEVKQSVIKAMEENGIKSFENDVVKITYCEPTTRTSIDTDLIKQMGMYHTFSKESPVKASVRMTWKKA